ncbi:hypothetical protein HPB47_012021 [Ixodes persulcatus]|uniref:Uncharacterized protein n=1 Tax=Ixodes persulcatus TaxID=34615 RepID=A0AC60NUM9_IXOPE|nr:hypothetical protein HPB47_012021 [Ixodes persulcatus]
MSAWTRKEVCADELETLCKKLRKKHRRKRVQINLPKFELDAEHGLVPVLTNLRLASILEINAESWGISAGSAVVVSDVRHKGVHRDSLDRRRRQPMASGTRALPAGLIQKVHNVVLTSASS